ncbi:Uncharacterized protein OBRU01_22068 [Operophtera brumata]|uniref:Fucosyltransferase n=1 Tax=Operophtera brumata TaxID=104452 RepID=A0A0L7KRZ8_OPEBR|nr:Uncharacterized protein OBRU01_22068 [Operophtera brumata]
MCMQCAVLIFQVWLPSVYLYGLRSSYERLAKTPGMVYILQWTSPHTEPFVFMNSGVDTFVKRKCPVMNCYVTSNRNLLGDVTNFDVLLFHGKEVVENKAKNLPKRRTHCQKYVFSSMESSVNYPVPKIQYKDYFNMTWTYKLDSDIYFGYIVIKNRNGDIIGPHMVMHWMNNEEMLPINDTIKTKIANKNVAAAWFVSNCRSNAAKLDPTELARQMFELINEPDRYNDFFKWHNHYSYHDLEESPDTDPYCKLCDYVNRMEFGVKSKHGGTLMVLYYRQKR